VNVKVYPLVIVGSSSAIAVLSEVVVRDTIAVFMGAVCVQTPIAPGLASNKT
jgi:hypothetical protein